MDLNLPVLGEWEKLTFLIFFFNGNISNYEYKYIVILWANSYYNEKLWMLKWGKIIFLA